jgi:hypothetical protein
LIDPKENISQQKKETKYFRLLTFLTLSFFAAMILMVWGYNFFFSARIGEEQPVAFSHRIHAGVKKISCFMCHQTAMSSSNAGVPPLETCMLCHQTIIIHHPEIEKLRKHYAENKPIEWTKVTYLPDFTFFEHSVHIQKGIDCSRCHGNINEMDRVIEVRELTMGFCMDCHKAENASTDCYTCHR